MINIDQLISEATKQRSPALGVYRLIKAEFLRWVKDNPGQDFNEAVEQKILKKMSEQRMESLKIYEAAGRKDLADAEAAELQVITPFLPVAVPDEEIENYTNEVISSKYSGNVTMKDMKAILAIVQAKYPDAPGKIVSKVVKSHV